MALTFVKEGCSCNRPVFDLKYLRTHRAGSVKLIRCFPHCCPSHSYANFCTSSVGIKAHRSGDADIIESDRSFLRFQPTMEHVYQPGEEIDATTVMDNIRTADNLKGEWIPCESVNIDPSTPNEFNYRFNHVNSVGWHYGWMGTSTKAHRTCTHHLVAYILRRVARSNGIVFQVCAVLPSPPFIVMSYRRACYKCQKHRDSDENALCECEGEFNVSQGQLSLPASPTLSLSPAAQPVQPTALSSMERELLSIYLFLYTMPAPLFADHFSRLESHLTDQLLIPLQLKPPPFPLLGQLLRPTYQRPPLTNEMQTLLACVADCVLHGLSFAAQNRQNFSHYASFLFDKKALNESYLHWLQSQYDLLNDRLMMNYHTNVAAVASQIRQSSWQFEEMLQRPSCFEYYVAQLREVYLGTKSHAPPAPIASELNGRWSFSQFTTLAFGQTDPSLLTALRWISMLYALELNYSGTSLHVRSELQLYSTIWSEFLLDGTPRVFRAFPNGESTMANISGFHHGDYIGYSSGNYDEVNLQLYSWPVEASVSFITRCRLKGIRNGRFTVEIQVCQSSVESTLDWSTMTAEERCSLYVPSTEEVIFQCVMAYEPTPHK